MIILRGLSVKFVKTKEKKLVQKCETCVAWLAQLCMRAASFSPDNELELRSKEHSLPSSAIVQAGWSLGPQISFLVPELFSCILFSTLYMRLMCFHLELVRFVKSNWISFG